MSLVESVTRYPPYAKQIEFEERRAVSKFWSPFVKDLVPYVPGEQPKLSKLVKLNTNENPYPPAPGVEAALREGSEA